MNNLNISNLHLGIAKQVAIEKTKEYIAKWFETKKDFEIFLLSLQEPIIGTKSICDSKHDSQLDVLWQVVSGAVKDFIIWANRAGSKTYFAGLISWLKSSHYDLCETNILGASEEQSSKAYKAMDDFWRITNLNDELLKNEPQRTKTEWLNGSIVQILTASQRSVRGPHPQNLILDEVDEMDLDIYEAALSQPLSKHNIQASIGIFSTVHNVDGTMEYALKIAEQTGGFKLYKYCIWECIESCQGYKCSTCKLSSICPGQQVKEADGYYKIEDFIKKLQTLSWDTIQREWLCKKVGRGDLVYQNEWNDDLHVIDRPFNENQECFLSLDWGGVHPFSAGVWQNFSDVGWVRVDEVYMGNTTNSRFIKTCKSKLWWKNINSVVGDPSRADLIQEWREDGIVVIEADNRVDAGIEAVKGCLRPVIGNPKFYINRICVDFKREINSYKTKNGKIVKENDHTMDEARYFVMWKIHKSIPATLVTSEPIEERQRRGRLFG